MSCIWAELISPPHTCILILRTVNGFVTSTKRGVSKKRPLVPWQRHLTTQVVYFQSLKIFKVGATGFLKHNENRDFHYPRCYSAGCCCCFDGSAVFLRRNGTDLHLWLDSSVLIQEGTGETPVIREIKGGKFKTASNTATPTFPRSRIYQFRAPRSGLR